jgi:hypothetical protein
MGRVKDIAIDKMDEYYATQQSDYNLVQNSIVFKNNDETIECLVDKLVNVEDDIEAIIAERDFYKARFEWERARVYKAWKDDPWARRRLAYKRRWKQ